MLNSRSFNIMKALEEAETFEINKKITVDSYHESLIESAKMNEDSVGNNTFTDRDEAEYYRNKELYHQSGLERHKKAMDKAKEACKNKGIEVDETEGVYESCNKNLKEDEDTGKEERLAEDYKSRVLNNITPDIRNNFNDLKNIMDTDTKKTLVDGFYLSEKAVAILKMVDKSYHLNSYMNLTISDILNMVDDNDTIEGAINELFEEYKADSAYSWADNFITILSKLDFDIQDEDELEESKSLKEDEDTSKEERLASLKTQLEQDGDQLSDDEKEAIQAEINELENEEPSMNESVTIAEIEEITQRIESAEDMDEIQQIIYTISDGVLEDEVQNMFDSCNENDDLDEVKSLVLTTLEDNAEYDEEDSLTEASTPNVEKFIYDLDVDSGNAWSVNYNDRKRGVEVYKNGKSEKTVDDIIKAVTSKYPQLKVSMKGKNTVLFKYDDKDKSLKEDNNLNEDTVDTSQEFFGHSLKDDIDEYEGPVPFDRFLQRAIDFGVEDEAFEKYGNRSRTSVNKLVREYYRDYKAKMNQAIKSDAIDEAETPEAMQAIADKQMPKGGYRYMARHAVGPGTLPDDIKVFKTEDTDDGKIAMYISRPLTSEELKKYDIDPEWIQEEATMKKYKVSFYVDTDTMNNMDIEEKVAEILAGSGLASTDETIDVENITDLTEADNITETKVSDLKNIKSQGNIYMLQDNKRFIVGENYDEAQGLIENAEIYDNKDDADKDYLDRCDITKDGKKVQLNGQDEIDKE